MKKVLNNLTRGRAVKLLLLGRIGQPTQPLLLRQHHYSHELNTNGAAEEGDLARRHTAAKHVSTPLCPDQSNWEEQGPARRHTAAKLEPSPPIGGCSLTSLVRRRKQPSHWVGKGNGLVGRRMQPNWHHRHPPLLLGYPYLATGLARRHMQLSWLWDPGGGPLPTLLLQSLHQPWRGGPQAAKLVASQGALQRNYSKPKTQTITTNHTSNNSKPKPTNMKIKPLIQYKSRTKDGTTKMCTYFPSSNLLTIHINPTTPEATQPTLPGRRQPAAGQISLPHCQCHGNFGLPSHNKSIESEIVQQNYYECFNYYAGGKYVRRIIGLSRPKSGRDSSDYKRRRYGVSLACYGLFDEMAAKTHKTATKAAAIQARYTYNGGGGDTATPHSSAKLHKSGTFVAVMVNFTNSTSPTTGAAPKRRRRTSARNNPTLKVFRPLWSGSLPIISHQIQVTKPPVLNSESYPILSLNKCYSYACKSNWRQGNARTRRCSVALAPERGERKRPNTQTPEPGNHDHPQSATVTGHPDKKAVTQNPRTYGEIFVEPIYILAHRGCRPCATRDTSTWHRITLASGNAAGTNTKLVSVSETLHTTSNGGVKAVVKTYYSDGKRAGSVGVAHHGRRTTHNQTVTVTFEVSNIPLLSLMRAIFIFSFMVRSLQIKPPRRRNATTPAPAVSCTTDKGVAFPQNIISDVIGTTPEVEINEEVNTLASGMTAGTDSYSDQPSLEVYTAMGVTYNSTTASAIQNYVKSFRWHPIGHKKRILEMVRIPLLINPRSVDHFRRGRLDQPRKILSSIVHRHVKTYVRHRRGG